MLNRTNGRDCSLLNTDTRRRSGRQSRERLATVRSAAKRLSVPAWAVLDALLAHLPDWVRGGGGRRCRTGCPRGSHAILHSFDSEDAESNGQKTLLTIE